MNSRPQARLEHFRAYIERRLDDTDFRLAEISRAFRLSDSYVRRVFRQGDESPSTFVRRRRLELAARRLRDGGWAHRTILAIALECGFNDAAHFSRCFVRSFGMSPRAYRKRGCAGRQAGLGGV